MKVNNINLKLFGTSVISRGRPINLIKVEPINQVTSVTNKNYYKDSDSEESRFKKIFSNELEKQKFDKKI